MRLRRPEGVAVRRAQQDITWSRRMGQVQQDYGQEVGGAHSVYHYYQPPVAL